MKILLDKLNLLYASNKDIKILDIGGWFAPCTQATHMVDIMPYDTMNTKASYGNGELKITKNTYLQMDISSMDKLPYRDDEFDYVICRHTLEDIMNPLVVCREMIRVGKAGYIETPSRLYESTKGVERPSWCGHYHHRWLVEVTDNEIIFQFKPHNIHFRKNFYFRRYFWQKFKEEYANTFLSWENNFKYRENIIIDLDEVKEDLKNFKRRYKNVNFLKKRWD